MRYNYIKDHPNSIKGLVEIENYVKASGLDLQIYELVKLRASQINGCAFCLNMHAHDAIKMGMDPQKIYTLSAWKETNFFSEKEQAAIEWTEAMTKISEHLITDELYEKVSKYFGSDEMMALNMAVIAINGWNRLAISSKKEPLDYSRRK